MMMKKTDERQSLEGDDRRDTLMRSLLIMMMLGHVGAARI